MLKDEQMPEQYTYSSRDKYVNDPERAGLMEDVHRSQALEFTIIIAHLIIIL